MLGFSPDRVGASLEEGEESPVPVRRRREGGERLGPLLVGGWNGVISPPRGGGQRRGRRGRGGRGEREARGARYQPVVELEENNNRREAADDDSDGENTDVSLLLQDREEEQEEEEEEQEGIDDQGQDDREEQRLLRVGTRRIRGVEEEQVELADRLDPEVPGSLPGPPQVDGDGWTEIDRLGAWDCALNILYSMEDIPDTFRVRWGKAVSKVLQAILSASSQAARDTGQGPQVVPHSASCLDEAGKARRAERAGHRWRLGSKRCPRTTGAP